MQIHNKQELIDFIEKMDDRIFDICIVCMDINVHVEYKTSETGIVFGEQIYDITESFYSKDECLKFLESFNDNNQCITSKEEIKDIVEPKRIYKNMKQFVQVTKTIFKVYAETIPCIEVLGGILYR